MRMSAYIDQFVDDMWADGRFNSPRTDRGYRQTLDLHAEDVEHRNPHDTNREDVKRTLLRWGHPNTRSLHRSHLVSFYDWCLEEGIRKDNPARQTRRPKVRLQSVYRLTTDEVHALRAAAITTRERRAVDLGVLTGLRAAELCGMQGRHFRRQGWVWVSSDVGKGNRERWVPVPDELAETWREIAEAVQDEEYALAHQHSTFVAGRSSVVEDASRPTTYQTLWELVRGVGRRAGIKAPVHPHLLRHAYGDRVARLAGMREAQFVLGHARVSTTERYTGPPTLDEVRAALRGFGYGTPSEERAAIPLHAPAHSLGLESSVRLAERILSGLWGSQALRGAA